MHFCEICAHLFVDPWYYIYRKNPPIHYIVFATPHKKKYLLQKRQPRLSFLRWGGCILENLKIQWIKIT